MSKILSSYKIIKNDAVTYDENNLSIIDTKIKAKKIPHPIIAKEEEVTTVDIKKEVREELREELLEGMREEVRKVALEEAEKEKQTLIQNAYTEVEKIKAIANKEGHEKGFKVGLEQGYSEGMHKAEEESQKLKEYAVDLIKQANTEVEDYFQENNEAIIRLAGDMAEKIVHTFIDASSENIIQLIKPVIEQHRIMGNIIIRCHPENMDYVKMNLYQLENVSPEGRFIVLEDGNLEKNGIIIENEQKIVDLQIKKQIQSMIDDLKNMG